MPKTRFSSRKRAREEQETKKVGVSRAWYAMAMSTETWQGRAVVLSQLRPPVTEEEQLKSFGFHESLWGNAAHHLIRVLSEQAKRPSITWFRQLIQVSLWLI